MAEVRKYSLTEKLREADEKLQDSPSLLGITSLTWPGYVNAMRATMFTTHVKQFKNLTDSEFPLVFTNSENMVGKNSTSYKKLKNKTKIIRKIAKFDDIVEKPFIYKLFVYDTVKQRYDVIERRDCVQLTQDFGYNNNNEVIDSLKEGDIVDAETVLYKSSSYDDDMNYGYGKNISVMYSLEPFTSEDGAVISESLSHDMRCIETETIRIGINNNDYLLNLYGDKKHYKPLPDIGESVDNVLAVVRRQYNNQLLFDFKDKSLRTIQDADEVYNIDVGTQVIDYTIYNNADERKTSPFYQQINKYIDSQNKYYSEIIDTCKTIINSGKEYSRDIDYLYKRSKEIINANENQKWRINESSFDNMMIEVTFKRTAQLGKACKLTFRCGNKSVVSKIWPDNKMPYTKDGRRVDCILNLLAIINRTTAFPLFEIIITGSAYKIRQRMAELKTLNEKADLMFDFIGTLNTEQATKMKTKYKQLKQSEKEAIIKDAIENGIYIHQPPLWEKEAVFYKCMKIFEKFPFIKRDKLFINKWGREIPILSDYFVGQMYGIRLKQTDRNGFSARSTGAIDNRGLPTKSTKYKNHLESHSTSCIRFGESETLNFSIGVLPKDIALFNALYRTSIKGRKDLQKAIFSQKGIKKLDKTYTSRVAEIFSVILKASGIGLDFIDEDSILEALDRAFITEHEHGKETVLCTEYQFYILKKVEKIKEEIFSNRPLLTTEELDKLIQEELENRQYLNIDVDYHDMLTDDMNKRVEEEIERYVEKTMNEIKEASLAIKKENTKEKITIDTNLGSTD